MNRPIRLALVRHGETVGNSSIRYHGITDVVLSSLGRAQAHEARARLAQVRFDRVVASSLTRAWQTATVIAPEQPILLEEGLREVDFGRWEGLTREEIAGRDPALYAQWQQSRQGFDYPDGEAGTDFRARIGDALQRLLTMEAPSLLVVAHKGVIGVLFEALMGSELPPGQPELGGVLRLERVPGGVWRTAPD
jgi:broad specificity phosphatase PhoE